MAVTGAAATDATDVTDATDAAATGAGITVVTGAVTIAAIKIEEVLFPLYCDRD